jgi:hypothetical protein
MKFMIILKATADSEAGVLPDEQLVRDMMAYNEQLVEAGVMRGGDGLQASSRGARVRFNGDQRVVVDGPFAETKELVAGYWIFETKSLQEAIDWVKKCPKPMPGPDAEIEIRQIIEPSDLGEGFTPELQELEERLRKKIEAH